MRLIDQLLTVAEAYSAAAPAELSTVSWRVFGDTKKLAAIRDHGADIQVGRYEKAMTWFAANWPDGADWPKGVARPKVRGVVA